MFFFFLKIFLLKYYLQLNYYNNEWPPHTMTMARTNERGLETRRSRAQVSISHSTTTRLHFIRLHGYHLQHGTQRQRIGPEMSLGPLL